MYKRIEQQVPQLDKYVEKLLSENTFSKEDIDEHKKWVWGMLNDSYGRSKDYQPSGKEWLTSAWNGFASRYGVTRTCLQPRSSMQSPPMLRHSLAAPLSRMTSRWWSFVELGRARESKSSTSRD